MSIVGVRRYTAETDVGKGWLGRPWRPSAQVILLDSEMGAHVEPAGFHLRVDLGHSSLGDTHLYVALGEGS